MVVDVKEVNVPANRLAIKRCMQSITRQLQSTDCKVESIKRIASNSNDMMRTCTSTLLSIRNEIENAIKEMIISDENTSDNTILHSLLSVSELNELRRSLCALLDVESIPSGSPHIPDGPLPFLPRLDMSGVRKEDQITSARSPRFVEDGPVLQVTDFHHYSEDPDSVEVLEVSDSSVDNNETADNSKNNINETLFGTKKNVVSSDVARSVDVLSLIPSVPINFTSDPSAKPLVSVKHLCEAFSQTVNVTNNVSTGMSTPERISPTIISSVRSKPRVVDIESDEHSVSLTTSDQSAGELPGNRVGSLSVINVLSDGSLLRMHQRLPPNLTGSPRVIDVPNGALYSSIPGAQESHPIWNSPQRKLKMPEMDISSSFGSNEKDNISGFMPVVPLVSPLHVPVSQSDKVVTSSPVNVRIARQPSTSSSSSYSHRSPRSTTSSSSSHQDEEATYNQVTHMDSI